MVSGFPTGVENMGWGLFKIWWGGGGLSQYMGEDGGSLNLNAVEKYLWSSFDSKVAGYKPASLQV